MTPIMNVVLGALLATLGGFLAGRLAASIDHRKRARLATMICAEVLMTLDRLSGDLALIHGRGDPFGTLTLRVIRSARREVDFYERNREATFELPDEALRARIHTLMIRLAVPLDHLLDQAAAANGAVDDPGPLYASMNEAYRAFQDSCALINPMLGELRKTAR